MRVAYLVSRYPAVSHSFVMAEVRALRERGVEVDTITIRRPPEHEVLTEADRHAVATTHAVLPTSPAALARAHAAAFARAPGRYLATLLFALRLGRSDLRGLLWQLFYFAEAMLVREQCEQRGIQHIHVHFANVAADVAMLVARYGKHEGFGWSFTLHGPVELFDVQAHRLVPKARDARFVACISHFARSQLMAFVEREAWEKLLVVRCGIDPQRFRARADRQGEGRVKVLSVGRLSERKGHALLVQAMADVEDAELVLVGDGEERRALEALAHERGIEDRVHFAGAVGQDRVPAFYEEADVFCLPSFAEGVPVVLMEAMASELPVVASRIMGVPELVEDGVAGILVPPGEPAALSDALRRLARDRDARRRMGAAGRRKVLHEYRIEYTAERLEQALRDYGA